METWTGYDAWKTRSPYEDDMEHREACPAHPDHEDAWPFECGGQGDHLCSFIHREINGCELQVPECDGCLTDEDIEIEKSERAEARAREL